MTTPGSTTWVARSGISFKTSKAAELPARVARRINSFKTVSLKIRSNRFN